MCRHRLLVVMGMVFLLTGSGALAQDSEATQSPPTLNDQIHAVLSATLLAEDLPTVQSDSPARTQFIEQCVDRFAAIYPALWAAPSPADLERTGRQLLTDNANDPVVVMLYGLIRQEMGAPADAAPWLERGLRMSEDYPASAMLLRAMATAALAECSQALGSNASSLWHEGAVLAAWVANDTDQYDGALQGALLEVLNKYILEEMPLNPQLHLVDRCAALPNTTEWLCKMLAAQAHLYARAHPNERVSSSRFHSEFQMNMDQAQRLLRAATALRPDLPQAPTAMLRTLYISQQGYEPSMAQSWFEMVRAIDASYLPAYFAYTEAINRSNYWGRDTYLLQLANQCLASDAYDTAVPAYYLSAVYYSGKVSNSYDWDAKTYLRNNANSLNQLVRGYQQADLPPSDLRDRVNAISLVVATITKDWPAARRSLDAIDNLDMQMPVLEQYLSLIGTSPVYVLGQTYAETGPRAAGLAESRVLYRDKKYDEAMALLTRLVRQEDVNGHEIAYLHSAIQYVLATKELQADRWINMMPDPLLTGWTLRNGTAWVDSKGQLVCLPGANNQFRLTYNRPVGTQFEYRGTVRRVPTSPSWQAGLSLGDNSSWAYYQLLLSENQNSVLLMDRHYSEFSWGRSISNEHTLDLLCWNQQVTVYLDDELVQGQVFVNDLVSQADSKIGVSAYYTYAPAVYSGLQFRLLAQAQQIPPGERAIPQSAPVHTYRPAYMTDEQLPKLVPVSVTMQSAFTQTDQPRSARSAMQRLRDGWDGDTLFLPTEGIDVLSLPEQALPTTLYAGDPASESVFIDSLSRPGYLAGLRLRITGNTILGLEPIYSTDTGRALGGRNGLATHTSVELLALDGYAVGGIALNGTAPLTGVQLIFMRMTPEGLLDPTDQYRSQWLGLRGDVREFIVDGGAVTGLIGDFGGGSAVSDLGLVLSDRAEMRGVPLPTEMPPVSELALPAFPLDAALLQVDGRYYMPLGVMTRQQARDECERLGGHLPQIDSADDAALLHRLLLSMSDVETTWLDASFDDAGQLVWLDGQAREQFIAELAPDSPLKPGRQAVLLAQTRRAVTDSIEADALQFAFCQWDSDPRPADAQPAGEFPGAVEFNGQWYAAIPLPMTFTEAQQLCTLMGGQLATITDIDANAFIASLASGQEPVWIGLASDDQGQWRWLDDAALEFSALARSHRREPDLAGAIHPTLAKWVDSSPGAYRPFVCQWPTAPTAEAWLTYNTKRFSFAPGGGSAPSVVTDDGVTLDPVEFEGHWYQAFPAATPWTDARTQCEAMGGTLIVINSDAENTFASFFVVGPQALWIGLSDTNEEGTWQWVDGGSPTFTAWAPGEPNDWGGNEDYVFIGLYQEGPTIYPLWNDYHDASEYGFLCEWDHDPTAVPGPADDTDE